MILGSKLKNSPTEQNRDFGNDLDSLRTQITNQKQPNNGEKICC